MCKSRRTIEYALIVGFLAGLVAGFFGGVSIEAGERVIFRNSNSKIRLPEENIDKLKNSTITPHSEGFDKKHSSVDGVMAPWQNPMNSRSSLKHKQRLLKAFDRQKNWMLQDPDELLNSTELTSEADLEDLDFETTSSRGGRSGRSSFERYYLKRESADRYGFRRNNSRRNQNLETGADSDDDLENGIDDEPKDSFATPKYFEARFGSIFDDPSNAAGTESTTRSTSNENIAIQSPQRGQLETFTEAFSELGFAPQQQQQEGTSQEFEKLLNTSVMEMTAANQGTAATGLAQGPAGANIGFAGTPGTGMGIGNSNIQSPIRESFRSTISTGLGVQSAMGDNISGSPFGTTGGASSTLGLFESQPATQSIVNRPAVFELPQRSF